MMKFGIQGVFEVADYESELNIRKLKMAYLICWTTMLKVTWMG